MSTGNESASYNLNPSDDVELNLFLADLADDITKDELKKLKLYISGRGGSGKAALERIEDAIDYFDHLRQKQLLSLDNLCILQAFIWRLGKKDWYEKFIDFGRKIKRTLYFYAPRDTPENGYKYLKFHVVGQSDVHRVDEVRFHVARLLGVPKEFVTLVGVEASNSLIITFMVPEECKYVLIDLTNDEKSALLRISVDYFTFDGTTTILTEQVKILKDLPNSSSNIHGKVKQNPFCQICFPKIYNPDTYTVVTTEESEEVKAVRKALLNEQKMQKELDSCHGEITMFKKRIKNLQTELQHAQEPIIKYINYMEIARYLYNMFLLSKMQGYVPALQRQASVKYLSVLLEKVNRMGYDRKLIDELLQVNGIIAKSGISEAYVMQINQLKWELQLANSQIVQLDYLCQRMAFTHGVTKTENDERILSNEFLLYAIMQNALPVFPLLQEIGTPVDDNTSREILQELTKEMTVEDIAELRKKATLNKHEEGIYKDNPNMLLEILYNQNIQHGGIHLNRLVYYYLDLIKRPDLKQKFCEIVKKAIERQQQPSTRRSPTPSADVKSQTYAKSKTSEAKPKQRTGSPKPKMDCEPNPFSEINTRLQKLENVIEKAVKGSSGAFQSRNPYFEDPDVMKMAAKLYFSKTYASDQENKTEHKDYRNIRQKQN